MSLVLKFRVIALAFLVANTSAHAINGDLTGALDSMGQPQSGGAGSGPSALVTPSLASLTVNVPIVIQTAQMDTGQQLAEPSRFEKTTKDLIKGVAATAVSETRTQPTLRLYRGF